MISAKNPHADKAQYGPSERHIFGGRINNETALFRRTTKKKPTTKRFFLHSTVSANQATITSQIGLISHQMVSIEGTCVKYNENMYIHTNKG